MGARWWLCSFVLLCGCHDGSAPPQTAQGGAAGEQFTRPVDIGPVPGSADRGDDLQNPLIRGFGQLSDDTSVFTAEAGLGEMLAEADAAISDIKAENREALRSLTRQAPIGVRPPNIVLILADDLGYGELGCYGQQHIKTPHLDHLAAGGARFTDFYAGATADRPSRWCLMTGYDTSRAGTGPSTSLSLRPQHVTLGETLWQAGYSTALVGYWGLGTNPDGMPHLHGFDEWFGLLERSGTDYPDQLWSNGARVQLVANANQQRGQFLPDVLIAEAISAIKRRPGDRPFFLLTSLTRPSDAPRITTYATQDWPPERKAYAAGLTRMDEDVGRLVHELDKQGLKNNTVVAFLSDNGAAVDAAHSAFFGSNGPLRGGKGDLYEGGLRVPAIISWPGKIPAGTVVSEPSAICDVLPTLADIARASRRPQRIDGISMLPMIRGSGGTEREMLYWEVREGGLSQAVRIGTWKVVRPAGRDRLEDVELYDLSSDPGERENVASKFPEIVAKFIR